MRVRPPICYLRARFALDILVPVTPFQFPRPLLSLLLLLPAIKLSLARLLLFRIIELALRHKKALRAIEFRYPTSRLPFGANYCVLVSPFSYFLIPQFFYLSIFVSWRVGGGFGFSVARSKGEEVPHLFRA